MQHKQSIYYSASSLYMFRGPTTPIIRTTQNCNYSLRYWSYFFMQLPPSNVTKLAGLATLEGGRSSPITRSTQTVSTASGTVQLPPSNWPSLATLEGDSCTSTGGCIYSFVYSWRWVCLAPETCRVNLQNNKRTVCVASHWTLINTCYYNSDVQNIVHL